MKLRIALLALTAAAGVFASFAVAKPPQGHEDPHHSGSTTGTTTTGTTTTGTTTTTSEHHGRGHDKDHGKVLVCHKVGHDHYVLIKVSAHSAPAKGKHRGDVLATNGTCPGPLQGHTGAGEHETTTIATTTTVATTTTT